MDPYTTMGPDNNHKTKWGHRPPVAESGPSVPQEGGLRPARIPLFAFSRAPTYRIFRSEPGSRQGRDCISLGN